MLFVFSAGNLKDNNDQVPHYPSNVRLPNVMAVGASLKSRGSAGINGSEISPSGQDGAVYVFARDGVTWSQQAFIKPGILGPVERLGQSVSLSADGNVLAVGDYGNRSTATGIDGVQANDGIAFAGAVYLFTRSESTWSEQAYIKASNTNSDDSNREFFVRRCLFQGFQLHSLLQPKYEYLSALSHSRP